MRKTSKEIGVFQPAAMGANMECVLRQILVSAMRDTLERFVI